MEKILIKIRTQGEAGRFALQADLELQSGGLYMLLGPSGSGKTSFLRTLAGLNRCREEYIRIGEKLWSDSQNRVYLQPGSRGLRMVFQNYATFQNMTVRENIELSAKSGLRSELFEKLIGVLNLQALLNRRTAQLSAGQKQRTAIACALIEPPQVLLLDEPLSVMDRQSKERFRNFIQDYRLEHGCTIFWASHDPFDLPETDHTAIQMADGMATVRLADPMLETVWFTDKSEQSGLAELQLDGERSKMIREAEGAMLLIDGRKFRIKIGKPERNEDGSELD